VLFGAPIGSAASLGVRRTDNCWRFCPGSPRDCGNQPLNTDQCYPSVGIEYDSVQRKFDADTWQATGQKVTGPIRALIIPKGAQPTGGGRLLGHAIDIEMVTGALLTNRSAVCGCRSGRRSLVAGLVGGT
jgi:hypothetical protein